MLKRAIQVTSYYGLKDTALWQTDGRMNKQESRGNSLFDILLVWNPRIF